ncbi:MAG: M48 family metallopeptidase [Bacteroidia bacterium]|nr:M48 family metallopeptidase [Bacteroidia bacterium]
MPEVKYGHRTIEYAIQHKEGLKGHYIIVERDHGVILKGPAIEEEKAGKYILKKARWILDKMDLVATVHEGDIVTGSRIPYLGKKYYTEVYFNDHLEKPTVEFNHSRFKITIQGKETQKEIRDAMDKFFWEKASEKITPRVEKWSDKMGIRFKLLHYRKQTKRWGSCTPRNNIIINTEAIKLPFTLIDYLIVHELCHVKFKDHSKAFWAEVGKYIRNWKELDERMQGMKM